MRSAHAASRPAPPASTADADRARIHARMDKPEPPRPDLRPPPPRSDVRPPPHRSDLRPPPTPTPQTPAPPSKPPRSRTGVIIALAIVGFIADVSIIDTFSGSDDGSSSGDEGTADTSDCLRPAGAWLDTLQSAFYKEYRSAAITSSAYVETETSEGTAYYVAVNMDGAAGTAVFGTSDPPLQSDPGLIAGANSTATQLSNLGVDIPEDSSAGALLLDDAGTFAAESCV